MNELLVLTSLEMLQKIISYHPTISSVCLIRHEVQLNWGQKYDSTGRILTHFDEALIQDIPREVKNLSVSATVSEMGIQHYDLVTIRSTSHLYRTS